MIHVDRDRDAPEALFSGLAEEARAAAQEFFTKRTRVERAQERFSFDQDIWLHDEVVSALLEMFRWKCAYCETPVVIGKNAIVDHFRPFSEAVGGKAPLPDGYWWLAYEWENLYLSCATCHANKGVQFPVAGPRATHKWQRTSYGRERALLLDPCREKDSPARSLGFDVDGKVSPRRHRDRGSTTIEVFGLNRMRLVNDRKENAIELARELHRLGGKRTSAGKKKKIAAVISERWLAPEAPFSASQNDVFRSIGLRRLPRLLVEPKGIAVILKLLPSLERLFGDREEKAPRGPPEVEVGKGATIRKVSIRNFKALRTIQLEFPERTSSAERKTGWKVLLGENGAGKSSVLQAVALAFLSSEDLERLKIVPERFVRRGCRVCEVEVELSTAEHCLGYTIRDGKFEPKAVPRAAGTIVRAYGASRLAAQTETDPSVGGGIRVDSLFDPHAELREPRSWLAKLRGSRQSSSRLTLRDLLCLKPEDRISRRKDQILVDIGDGDLPLDRLSDGYRSVIAMAVDVMDGMPEDLRDYSHGQGIVLVDELGTHLHPRWKMEIVRLLRGAFPSIQFFVTTHEPLCLKGLREGEVHLMERVDGEIVVRSDLPSPEPMRIDQLLTSRHFGLESTLDPDVNMKFQEYYELLAKRTLGKEEDARRQVLKAELCYSLMARQMIDRFREKLTGKSAAALVEG